MLLGAGGAARAIGVEVALAGTLKIYVMNRDSDRGKELAQLLNTKTPASSECIPWTGTYAIAADGDRVFRERIDLSETNEFGSRDINVNVDLTDRAWVRIEVWDIARNGAFTQPVWNTRPSNR